MALRLSAHMTVMQNAAQRASKRLLRDFAEVEQLQVSVKGPGDFVSQADLRAEQTLRDDLAKARPGYAFLMEESGESGGDNWTWRWVVDPLDGTTNFLHGIPHWAISIGLERRRDDGTAETMAGVVYSPTVDEMFWAEKGVGAFLNDRRIRVSKRTELTGTLLATGFPCRKGDNFPRYLAMLADIMPRTAGLRRPGAAALDLAYVAAGRTDGFFESGLKPWDIAAGSLLVTEAGGLIGNFTGEADYLEHGECIAAPPRIYGQLVSILARYSQFAPAHDKAQASERIREVQEQVLAEHAAPAATPADPA